MPLTLANKRLTSTTTSTPPPPAPWASTGKYVVPGRRTGSESPPYSSASSRRGSSSSDGSLFSSASISSPPSSSSPPSFSPAFLSNWRSNAGSLTSDFQPATELSWDEVKAGTVVYLPKTIPASSIFHAGMRAQNRNDKPQGHPCVILRKDARADGEQIVYLLHMTSFSSKGDNPLEQCSLKKQARMILCANQDASIRPHNGLLDVEAGSDKFQKATWLNYYGQKDLLPIELRHLEKWKGDDKKPLNIQFTAEAVRTINDQFDLVVRQDKWIGYAGRFRSF